MTGSFADFARHLGVNRSTVTRAHQAGRLVLAGAGRVDFSASIARMNETAGHRGDVAARHAQNRGADNPKGQPEQKNAATGRNGETGAIPEAGLGMADTGGGNGRARPQAIRMHFENSAIKLEMALRRGLRFDRGVVRREAAGLGALVRAGIERAIDLSAPRLAAAGDAMERRRIIEAEIRRLRWMVKRELPRALRRMQAAGQGAKVPAGTQGAGGGGTAGGGE